MAESADLKNLTYGIGFDLDDNGLTRLLDIENQIDEMLQRTGISAGTVENGLNGVGDSAKNLGENIKGATDQLDKIGQNAEKTSNQSSEAFSEIINTLNSIGEKAGQVTDMIATDFVSASQKSDNAMNNMHNHMNEGFGSMKTQMDLMFAGMSFDSVARPLDSAIDSSIGKYGQFDQAVANVNSMMGLTSSQVNNLKEQLLNLSDSKEVNSGPTELANALYGVVGAGVPANESMTVLTDSAKAATAGQTDLGTATNALIAVMDSYGLKASSLGKISDEMFAANQAGAMTFDSFAKSIGNVAGPAAQTGVSFDQVAAATAALTNQGLSAQRSTQGLRALLLRIAAPTTGATKAAQSLGIQWNESALKSKGLVGMLQEAMKATHGNADELKKLIPNIAAWTVATDLGGKGAQSYTQAMATMSKSAGATNSAMAEQEKGYEEGVKRLQTSIEKLQITFVSSFAPGLSKAADAVSKLIDGFNKLSPGTKSLIENAIIGVAVFSTVGSKLFMMAAGAAAIVAGFGSTIGVISLVIVGVSVLAAGAVLLITHWNSLNNGFKAGAGVIAALGAGFLAYKATMLAMQVPTLVVTTAIKMQTAAQWLLNAAMSANPIGIVIGAIAALAVGFILLYKNSSTFRNLIGGLWKDMQGFGSWISGGFTSAIHGIGKAWGTLKTDASSAWNGLKSFLSTWGPVALAVLVPFIGIPLLIKQHWGGIKNFFGTLGNDIKQGVLSGFNSAKNSIHSATTDISNGVKNGFNSAKSSVHSAMSDMSTGIKNGFNAAKSDTKSAFDIIKNTITTLPIGKETNKLYQSMSPGIKTSLDGVYAVTKGTWDKIKTETLGAVLLMTDKITGNQKQYAADKRSIDGKMLADSMYTSVGLKNIYQGATSAIKSVWHTGWTDISTTAKNIQNTIKTDARNTWNNMKTDAHNTWQGIKTGFHNDVNAIKTDMKNTWNTTKTDAHNTWSDIKTNTHNDLDTLGNNIKTSFNTFKTNMHNSWEDTKTDTHNAWTNMKTSTHNDLNAMGTDIKNGWNDTINWFKTLPGKLYQEGKDIFSSMKKGVNEELKTLGTDIKNDFNDAVKFFEDLPSEALKWGQNMIDGFMNGIKNKAAGLGNSIRSALGFSTTSSTVNPSPASVSNSAIGKNANGTNNWRGGLTLVGEKGPELVDLPQGTKITPNDQLSNSLNQASSDQFSDITTQYNKQVQDMQPTFKTYGQQLNNNLGNGLASSTSLVSNPINNQLNDTNATLSNFSKSSIAYGQQMNSSVGNGIQTTDINVYNPLDNMVNNVKTTLQNFATSSIQYGKDTVTQIGQGIQASQDNLTGIVTTLTNKVVDSFKQGFGIHSPSTVMYSIGNYLMQGLVNGMSASDVTAFVTKQIGSATSAATGAVGGNITNWLTVAMGITGTPITFLPMLQSIAMHEFGGDPHSINLWDSNAAAGHPSKGLMQMIDETFNSYKMPGLNDIWNPIDNAVSSIRYMEGRYGSIANVPGVRNMVGGGGYVGYANGTNNATAGLHWIGENGPELMRFRGGEQVIPSRESQQILQNSYGGNTNVVIQSSPTFQINIDGSDKDAKSIAAEVERILRTRFGEFFDGEMKSILRQLGMA